jgi:hypothetical protein
MPFGDISLPPGAFQQPNIAGGFLSGMMGMQELQTSQARADALQSLALREQQKLEEESQWNEAVKANLGGPDQEQGLAALYKINPERAMGLAKSQYEVNKLKAEGGRIGADTQGKQIENEGKNADIAKQEAVGAAHYMKTMGANANPQALAGYLMARSKTWGERNPEVARQLQEAAGNPDVLPHIMAAAKAGGYKDPDEEMQRDVSKANQINAYQQGLGPTPYQQQQLAQQGQQQQQTRQAQLTEQQRSDARWLIDKHDSAPEVLTYKRVLPKANAVLSAIKSTDPQSDVDIIYGLTNILDDLGSVREGDLAAIQGASSFSQWLNNLNSQLKQEGKLGPDARAGIANIIGRRMQQYESSYQARKSNLDALAQKAGLNPAEVFADPMAFTGQPQGGQPAQGQQQAPAPTGGLPEGRVAINPATGQRMIVRNGQLVPQ